MKLYVGDNMFKLYLISVWVLIKMCLSLRFANSVTQLSIIRLFVLVLNKCPVILRFCI